MKSLQLISRWLWFILVIQLGLGLITIVVTPLWQAHEADFYNVVRFILDNGRMPSDADYPPGQAEVRQATQPPLYFITSLPIVALLDDAQPVPPGVQPGLICIGGEAVNSPFISYPINDAYVFPVYGAVLAGYGLRVANLLFGTIAVVFTFLAGRVMFPNRPGIWLVGAALLAFEPNILQMVTTIGNEALLLALVSANLYCAVRTLEGCVIRWRWTLPLIGLAGLAILTRLPGWAVLGFDVLIFLFAIGYTLWQARKRANRGQFRGVLIGVVLLVATIMGVAVFNYTQYGSVFGRYRQLDEVVVYVLQNFNLSLETIVGVFGQTQLSYEAPLSLLTTRRFFLAIYTLAVIVALTGAFLGLVEALVRYWRKQDTSNLGAYLLLMVAVAIGVVLVLFRNTLNVSVGGGVTLYNTAAIYAPLRYYNTSLPPLALLLSAGLATIVKPLRIDNRVSLQRVLASNPLGLGLATIWLGVSIFGALVLLIRRPEMEVLNMQAFQSMESNFTVVSADVLSPDQPVLLGYSAEPRALQGMVNLTLYAQQPSRTTLNYAVQVDMIVDGNVISTCQFLPTRGVNPTTLWSSQNVVKFSSTIPNCTGEINKPVDLSLRWLGADVNGVIQDETQPIALGTLDPPLAQASTCPQTLSIFADGYRLTQFNSPTSVQRGETYLPSANWIVTQTSPEVAERIFLFTHEETGEQYLCSASDSPVSSWVLGEYKYFDRCTMVFPPEATPGNYAVSIVMVNAMGERVSATDVSGRPFPFNEVSLGIVTVA